ncbi:dynamin family protein [Lacrimispora sp.]|uniref:dynamin family protein n=1 Tax=Lacrimispora sp. TaxID=2719234 RepID=UPI003993A574
MQTEILRAAQYVLKHPVLAENEDYKKRYINTLEYFVRKYSGNDLYAKSMLELYKNKMLENPEKYDYKDEELKKISKGILSWKMKKFKFFSYRYCLLVDVIFICSYLNLEKSEKIYAEILEIYSKRYWKKLEELFSYVVGKTSECETLDQTDYIKECITRNRRFIESKEKRILITANMSAGKSTLLNSLIGKKVNKTQNDACTAKTHYLFNKAFEDTLSYEYDYELELDASYEVLMEDNDGNQSNEIYVGTRFRSIADTGVAVCFIDTPGVNSSQDKVHQEISEQAISNSTYDTLMYVMNSENIGTDDDRRHLEYVSENYKGRIIFVVNKLDRFRKEDSVVDTLEQVKKDLIDIGFVDPFVCPVSAYAGYLAKMSLYGELLNDDEQDELEGFYRKLSREKYQFNNYYPEGCKDIAISEDKNEQLLLHSGVLSLEKILYEER